jgi:hypothetical protein
VRTAFGSPKSGLSVQGSCRKTSTPAAAILPVRSAIASASWSTTSPRAMLRTIAVSLSCSMLASFSIWCVVGVDGT